MDESSAISVARNTLTEISNEIVLELWKAGAVSSNQDPVAQRLSRAIIGCDLEDEAKLQGLTKAQVAEISYRAHGCMKTISILAKEGILQPGRPQ